MDAQRLEIKEIPSGIGKFSDPDFTATGEARASVDPRELETLWVTACAISPAAYGSSTDR